MWDIFAAVENLLSNPEGECRDAGFNRCGQSRIPVLSLVLFPPSQLILAISHKKDGQLASGCRDRLSATGAVSTRVNHAGNFRERRQNRRDRLLRRGLIPVTLDTVDDLEFRVLFDPLGDPGMNRVVDRGADKTADF